MSTNIIKQFQLRIRYAACLLRIAGLRALLHELRCQIYCKYTQVGFETDITREDINHVPCKVKYDLSIANDADITEIFKEGKSESQKSRVQLAYCKWLFDAGFRTCYLARITENNDPAYFYFMISKEDLNKVDKYVRRRFPPLKDDEVFLDGAYTFEKYRGNRLHSSVLKDTLKIYADRGYTRSIGHIKTDNAASLVSTTNIGSMPFEEVRTLKILFVIKKSFKNLRKNQ